MIFCETGMNSDKKAGLENKLIGCWFVLILIILFGCGKRGGQTPTPTTNAISSNAVSAVAANTQIIPLTNMVLIKAGTYMRLIPAKKPTNAETSSVKSLEFPITLSHDFWLGKYEVTQGDYEKIMAKNPSNFPGETNRPVEKVTWFDAMSYCSSVTKRETEAGHLPSGYIYRLPTEAEWEYACRAGTTNFYSFGDSADQSDQYAWTLENSEGTPHPVGQKLPNPWGLYDMHGNVWEWCSDWFADYPPKPLKDPTGPAQGRFKVFRGGSWNHAVELARSRNRFIMSPTNGIYFVGFRLALSQAAQ
jgi:formylglycine-generating enzyme required for sulfatase activity